MKQARRASRSHSAKDNNNYLRVFTVVVLGDAKVGKSALVARFLEDEFEPRHDPTVENFYVKPVAHKDRPFELQIIDTSGTYEFPAMRRVAIHKADGILLVYSPDQEHSIDRLERYIAEVREFRKGNPVPMVIVSNKSDRSWSEEQRLRDDRGLFVSTAVYLEKKWGWPCMETSAKTNNNVEGVFMKLLSVMVEHELRRAPKVQLTPRMSASQLLQPLRRLRASKEHKEHRRSLSCVSGLPWGTAESVEWKALRTSVRKSDWSVETSEPTVRSTTLQTPYSSNPWCRKKWNSATFRTECWQTYS